MDITTILQSAPIGTQLYSTAFGECTFQGIDIARNGITHIKVALPGNGRCYIRPDGKMTDAGECLLFPSKDNRDWTTFKPGKEDTWKS